MPKLKLRKKLKKQLWLMNNSHFLKHYTSHCQRVAEEGTFLPENISICVVTNAFSTDSLLFAYMYNQISISFVLGNTLKE